MAQSTFDIVELVQKIDQKSDKTIEKNPALLKSHDIALVKIISLDSIFVKKYTDYSSLSRFFMVDRAWVTAIDTIKHVEKQNNLSIT